MTKAVLAASFAAFGMAVLAAAGTASATTCAPAAGAGSACEAAILDLRPTQFNLGLVEVSQRAEQLRLMSSSELVQYMKEHVAPVVIGPGGSLYILDRHHEARALLEIGVERMAATIMADWSGLPEGEFWKRMENRRWVWLFDEGHGPLSPAALPQTVLQMTDDPYRSLAREVRKAGGFAKSPLPFAEFRWADYFRPRVPTAELRGDFEKAVAAAAALAHDPAAKDLPGYIP